MHIKTVNTHSKYKCFVMRGNDSGRVNRGKGYRVVNRLSCCGVLPGANVFTLALIEAARSFFLLCFLD